MLTVLVIFAALIVILTAGAVYEGAAIAAESRRFPPPGQMVDLGTHKLHLRTLGTGGPAVVLIAGAGSPGLIWELVAREVARFARVVIVDRAGYGWSEPGPMPRTMAALSRFGVVRLLARVGALGDLKALANRMNPSAGTLLVSQSIRSSALAASASEMSTLPESYDLARRCGSLGDLPLVVLMHGKPGPVMPGTTAETAARIEAELLSVAREMAQLSTKGELVVAKESGHEIHVTEPHLVVAAIEQVAAAAR